MITPKTETFFSISECARWFDVSVDSIRRYEAMGVVHPVRIFGERAFTEADFDDIATYRAAHGRPRRPCK